MFKAKFKVHSVTAFEHGNSEVVMKATTAAGDSDFTKYTPSGELKFTCTNPEVNKQLAPGKVLMLTFEEELPF